MTEPQLIFYKKDAFRPAQLRVVGVYSVANLGLESQVKLGDERISPHELTLVRSVPLAPREVTMNPPRQSLKKYSALAVGEVLGELVGEARELARDMPYFTLDYTVRANQPAVEFHPYGIPQFSREAGQEFRWDAEESARSDDHFQLIGSQKEGEKYIKENLTLLEEKELQEDSIFTRSKNRPSVSPYSVGTHDTLIEPIKDEKSFHEKIPRSDWTLSKLMRHEEIPRLGLLPSLSITAPSEIEGKFTFHPAVGLYLTR